MLRGKDKESRAAGCGIRKVCVCLCVLVHPSELYLRHVTQQYQGAGIMFEKLGA